MGANLHKEPGKKSGSFLRRFPNLIVGLALTGISLGFLLRWEPAPCDVITAIALVTGVSFLKEGWRRLPRLLVVFLIAFILANMAGLVGILAFSSGLRFFSITLYLILFMVFINGLGSAHETFGELARRAYMFAAVVAAGLIWFAFLGLAFDNPEGVVWATRFLRPTGLFKDPNVAGSFLVAPLIFITCFILSPPSTRGSGSCYSYLLYLFLLSALLHTASRSAILAWGLGYITVLGFVRGKLLHKLQHLCATAGFLVLVAPFLYFSNSLTLTLGERVLPHMACVGTFIDRVGGCTAERLPAEQPSLLFEYDTGGRLYAWQAALRMWESRPLLGVGPGNFEVLSPGIERSLGARVITPSAHNTYLRILAENGIIGIMAFIAALVVTLVSALRTRRAREEPWLVVSFLALLLNGMFIDSLHFRHFWLIWALLLLSTRDSTSK
ncbi:O-antigen polymerase [Ammonifex degensii KC4]|uniref:O-antigen polymerase n=1 Tax=Ammonifex degensii (strain DSM 10501 / KC4) TaxID=429009 RepID=C9RBN1_AMMDK|nr:O-antigen ligase family protein [Ammonifex degensii]ACX51658.1 O-antigen polymerase [Ammonifex degensii KC4]